jgi:hypothetical protein
MTDKVTPQFYESMINILHKYNNWARDKNEKLPRKWFIMGIEEWLNDFGKRIENEGKKEFFNLELTHHKQIYEETKLITKAYNLK